MKRTLIAGMVLLGLIALYAGVSHKRGLQEKAAQKAAVQESAAVQYAAAEGRVETLPGFEVEVGSEIEGRIAEVLVSEGSQVKKGDLIARIENSDIQAKLHEARAALTVARSRLLETSSGSRQEEIRKAAAALESAVADREISAKELKRHEGLAEKGIISRSFLDEKERSFRVAAARVKEAEEEKTLRDKGPKQETVKVLEDSVLQAEATVAYYKSVLDKTYIAAPISGKVIRKYLSKGEMVSKEVQPYLVTVADIEKVRINAEVDETDIGRISLGDQVEVTTYAFPDTVFKGVVREISDYAGIRKVTPNNPAKNRDMKIVQVKIDLAEKTPLKLGMTVDVRIIPGKH
ncbi:MAG: HlyD family secretion protein [Nitrospirae bacterium]|nr:MAG: HlyD family secretion protein [Nitrospirota bacterium]